MLKYIEVYLSYH